MRGIRGRTVRWLLAIAALVLLPAGAWATPVTYGLSNGSVSLSLQYLTYNISIGPIALTSGSATFDPSGAGLTNFSFGSNTSITWSPAILGYDTLTLDLSLTPGSGYTSSDSPTGPGTYSVTGGPVTVSGSGQLTDTTAIPINLVPTNLASFLGTATLSGSNLGLNLTSSQAVQLGYCIINGTTVNVMGTLDFNGVAVPEPSVALLLLAGMGGLAAAGRRGRRQTA